RDFHVTGVQTCALPIFVEKGAQAYRLRVGGARNMLTCAAGFSSCTSLSDFSVANTDITQASLGVADATERASVIDWARGLDLKEIGRASCRESAWVQVV